MSATVTGLCNCADDTDVDTLRGMVAGGLDQWTASALLWGGPIVTTDVTAWVRAEFTRAFPWLRLPEAVTG